MKKNNREEARVYSLFIPMSKEEKLLVEEAAGREGMTMSAYARAVFGAAQKLSLARLLVVTEKEISKK